MISIVIPTCKKANLMPCLESIRKYTEGEVEIIVVANGYDGTRPKGCIWRKNKVGYPKACNLGIRKAKGEFIVLLNDDTVLLEQPKNAWLEILSAPFADPTVAITGPWMMHNTDIDRPFMCFFCCMIRRSVLNEIGLLDEAFTWGYAEDVDLSCKAVDAGYKVVQVPTSEAVRSNVNMGFGEFPIYHASNQTFKNWPNGHELWDKNHAILRERYGGIMIGNAMKLGEWITNNELIWLAKQAKKALVVIELGSWFGKSSTVIADNLPAEGVLYCVDTWAGSEAEKDTNHVQAREMDGDFAYDQFSRNLWRHIISGKVRPIRMHGVHAAKLLRDMGLRADLIFIDAGHLYHEVKQDIESFLPLLKEGGTICGHDYGGVWSEVPRAVQELFGDNVTLVDTIWSTQGVPRNIYECIMFGNELEMLERHLKTMWPVVDRFIITEATVTHAGKPKPLNFHNNLNRFGTYLSKITYVVVEDSPQMNGSERSAWEIEEHQRAACMRVLDCRDNDTVVVVDCDEIPNPEAVRNFNGELSALCMKLYLYDYKVKAKDPWRHGKVMPFRTLKGLGPNIARYKMDVPDIIPGGEHLSYFGGIDAVISKIHNTAHRNIDTPEFANPDHIRHCIENGVDLFKRDIEYEVIA